MKLRLFLFLFLAGSLLAGKALAQGCSTTGIAFPVGADKTIPPGTCIADADPDSPTGQGGRLRWDNNNNHELVLFDSEHGGIFLWCAGGGGNSNNCAMGTVLCAQADGNLVMYAPNGAIQPHCVNGDGGGGVPVWASNTDGANDGHEGLTVEENFVFGGTVRTGERAVIRNGSGLIFFTTGYTDPDD